MRIQLLKATVDGRNMKGEAIYPSGSWTVWKDEKFQGWNWDWQKIWEFVWDGCK